MYVRLVLIGDGTDLNQYRVDLPTYADLQTDVVTGTGRVFLGGPNVPPQMPTMGPPYWTNESGTLVLVGMPQDMLISWWQRLAVKYPDHFPPFTPGFQTPT